MAKRRGHSLPVTSRRPVGSSYASPLSTASCCSAGVRPRLRRSSAVSSPRRSTKQRTAPLRGSMTASRSSCHRLAQTSPRTHCSSFRLGSGRPAACTAMRRLTRNYKHRLETRGRGAGASSTCHAGGVSVAWAWRGARHGGWRAGGEAPKWAAGVGGCGGVLEASAPSARRARARCPSRLRRRGCPRRRPLCPTPQRCPTGAPPCRAASASARRVRAAAPRATAAGCSGRPAW
mmetsp:Transcript_19747/g.66657  ORF Transcript_19747/g.66657 Transcript_19747/m.66657 type:complete len:233 (+) Transcript_19747:550-1248(+)